MGTNQKHKNAGAKTPAIFIYVSSVDKVEPSPIYFLFVGYHNPGDLPAPQNEIGFLVF